MQAFLLDFWGDQIRKMLILWRNTIPESPPLHAYGLWMIRELCQVYMCMIYCRKCWRFLVYIHTSYTHLMDSTCCILHSFLHWCSLSVNRDVVALIYVNENAAIQQNCSCLWHSHIRLTIKHTDPTDYILNSCIHIYLSLLH